MDPCECTHERGCGLRWWERIPSYRDDRGSRRGSQATGADSESGSLLVCAEAHGIERAGIELWPRLRRAVARQRVSLEALRVTHARPSQRHQGIDDHPVVITSCLSSGYRRPEAAPEFPPQWDTTAVCRL